MHDFKWFVITNTSPMLQCIKCLAYIGLLNYYCPVSIKSWIRILDLITNGSLRFSRIQCFTNDTASSKSESIHGRLSILHMMKRSVVVCSLSLNCYSISSDMRWALNRSILVWTAPKISCIRDDNQLHKNIYEITKVNIILVRKWLTNKIWSYS